MRTSFVVVALAIAGVAAAQEQPSTTPPSTTPPPPTPAEKATQPPASQGLIGDIAYEPGVGVRFKTPKTTIVLYGIVEPTLSTVSNANDKGDRQTGYQVSWFSGNRWGITGAQSLVKDDSVRAIFRLESEFELPTGDMDTPGTIFNRDAWAGIESELVGKLTFGRQNTLARDFSQNYGDPYGTAQVRMEEGGWTNVNNFKQLIFFAGSVSGTRMDNGVVWKKQFGKNIVAGLGYQFGDVAGAFMQNSTGSAALALNFKPLVVSAFITEANHGGNNQHSYSIGGNYQVLEFLRLNGGYFHYEAQQDALPHRSDNAFTVSANVSPIADGFEFDLGFQRISVNGAAYNKGGNIINQFAETSAATSVGSGTKNTVYGSAIYHFNRGTQVYVAGDYMKLTDGYACGGGVAGLFGAGRPYSDQVELSAGMRIIF